MKDRGPVPPDVQALLDERKRTMAEFNPDHRGLVIYAVFPKDIEMPGGKLIAQCCHAVDETHTTAKAMRPDITAQYKGTGHGTKAVMYVKNQGQLLRAYRELQEKGLPCHLIIDRGHVLPPDFDGDPIITALGFGPVYRDEVSDITKRMTMY